MPGRRDRFELAVNIALEKLPDNVTYPLLIVCNHLGITPSEFILYLLSVVVIVLLFFTTMKNRQQKT